MGYTKITKEKSCYFDLFHHYRKYTIWKLCIVFKGSIIPSLWRDSCVKFLASFLKNILWHLYYIRMRHIALYDKLESNNNFNGNILTNVYLFSLKCLVHVFFPIHVQLVSDLQTLELQTFRGVLY